MSVKPLIHADYMSRCLRYLDDCRLRKKSWWHVIHNMIISWGCTADFAELESEFADELKKRNFDILDAWQDYPQYHDIVIKLQKIFNEILWKFDVVFIPEDDYVIIGQVVTGDLIEVEAIMEIEECFGLDDKVITDEIIKTDMLSFVKYIQEQMIRNK